MAGQPITRARRAAAARAAAAGLDRLDGNNGVDQAPAGHATAAEPLPPDAQIVALAGAVLLGRYRGTIAASRAPLQASLEVLDEQLEGEVARVRSWVAGR